jgi:hypothetical protein
MWISRRFRIARNEAIQRRLIGHAKHGDTGINARPQQPFRQIDLPRRRSYDLLPAQPTWWSRS